MKKLFLTGGSGFIGRHVLETLRKSFDVDAPTHKELDLTDEAAVRNYFRDKRFDVVIHNAVRPGHRNATDTSHQLNINLRMFFNILRNASHFKKLIFVSSGAVYDTATNLSKVNEDTFDSSVPRDEHGFSKYIIAKHLEILKEVEVVELRVFGIFGCYEDYAIRFISNALCKTLFDLPITIRQDRLFDYIYVDDFVTLLQHFINHSARHRAYNITPDEAISLTALAELVRRISGKNVPLRIAKEGMGLEYSGSNQRLREEIPGFLFTPIELSVSKLHGWYSQNIQAIHKDVLLFDK